MYAEIVKLVVALVPVIVELVNRLIAVLKTAESTMTDEQWAIAWGDADEQLRKAEASLSEAIDKIKRTRGVQ